MGIMAAGAGELLPYSYRVFPSFGRMSFFEEGISEHMHAGGLFSMAVHAEVPGGLEKIKGVVGRVRTVADGAFPDVDGPVDIFL